MVIHLGVTIIAKDTPREVSRMEQWRIGRYLRRFFCYKPGIGFTSVWIMAALARFLVLGLALGIPPALAADNPLEPPRLPAFYEGILPCADCPGIRYQLQLTESSFILRMRYLESGEDAVFDDMGRWSVEGSTLVLEGGSEAPVLFRILDAGTLRKLDLGGQEIESTLNYDLERLAEAEPIEPRLPMLGLFSYWADAARFMSCATGESWPVAMKGDYLELERAYMKMRSTAGEALLSPPM